jgi:hypothetical protein
MKKIFLFCLMLMAFSIKLYSQTAKFSPEFETDERFTYPVFIGSDDKSFCVLRFKNVDYTGKNLFDNRQGRAMLGLLGFAKFENDRFLRNTDNINNDRVEYTIEKYSFDLKQEWSSEVDFAFYKKNPDYKGKSLYIKKAFYLDEKVIAFSSIYKRNKKENETVISWHTIGKDGKFSEAIKPLSTFVGDDDAYGPNINPYEIMLSHDKSKFMLMHTINIEDNPSPKFIFETFDAKTMEKAGKTEFSIPLKEGESYEIYDCQVSKSGNMYLQLKVFLNKEDRKAKKMDAKYVLYRATKDGTVNLIDVSNGDNLVVDLKLNFTADGSKGYIMGYSSSKTMSRPTGYYVINFDDATGKIENSVFKDFTPAFIKDATGSEKEGDKEDLNNFHVRDFMIEPDGSIIVTSEVYTVFVQVTDRVYGMPVRFSFSYRYYDILLFKLNKAGEMTWNKIIPKAQKTADDGGVFISYIQTRNADEITLIYNGNPKDVNKTMYNRNSAIAYISTVTIGGEVKTKPLFDAREAESILNPRMSFVTPTNDLIFYNSKKKTFKWAKVKF